MIDLSTLSFGFRKEQFVVSTSTVNFYTCLVGPFRVYIWGSFERCMVQVEVEHNKYGEIINQFNWCDGHIHDTYTDDPFAVLGIIHHLTSEGNEDDAHPTGTTDGVLALHQ